MLTQHLRELLGVKGIAAGAGEKPSLLCGMSHGMAKQRGDKSRRIVIGQW
jgi:hypothetical protein